MGKVTFVMDRGYDDNKMFLKLDNLIDNAQSLEDLMVPPANCLERLEGDRGGNNFCDVEIVDYH